MPTPQADDKKTILEQVFTRTAESYVRIRYFDTFGAWLVDVAKIAEGAAVLDVACGRGAVLFPAGARVGTRGHVTGIDLAEGMARATQAEIDRRGIVNASARQMDAEHLDFADKTFDAVLCGFSLQFFPDLPRALGEFRRVLKPGGTLAVSTWGDDDPAWEWFDDLRKRYGASLRLASNSLDTPDKVTAALERGGFVDVSVRERVLDEVFVDEEEWWNVEWSISGREGLERLGPEQLAALKNDAFAHMQSQRTKRGFAYRLMAFLATARVPEY
jgi:ubiquinone/menaquinone biosynthesis C-methylase UbiE